MNHTFPKAIIPEGAVKVLVRCQYCGARAFIYATSGYEHIDKGPCGGAEAREAERLRKLQIERLRVKIIYKEKSLEKGRKALKALKKQMERLKTAAGNA